MHKSKHLLGSEETTCHVVLTLPGEGQALPHPAVRPHLARPAPLAGAPAGAMISVRQKAHVATVTWEP